MRIKSLPDKELLTVVVLYLLFTLGYSITVPLWEAPDEPSHYLTARRLSGLPLPKVPHDNGRSGSVWKESYLYSPYQRFQAPLYYPPAAAVIRLGALLGLEKYDLDLPPVHPNFNGRGPVFLQKRKSLRPIPGADLSGHFLRLFSIIFGAATVVLIYRMGKKISFIRKETAFLAAALAAFNPQFNFITGVIGNDPPAIFFSTAALLWMLARLDRRAPLKIISLLGGSGLIALAVAAKFNCIFLLPVALLFVFWRYKDSRGRNFRPLLLFLFPVILAGGAFTWNLPAAGVRFRILGDRLITVTPRLITPGAVSYGMKTIFQSFWALFGWMSVPVGWGLYLFWGGISLSGVIGYLPLKRRRIIPLNRIRKRQLLLLSSAFILLFLAVIKNNLLVPQSQGRFLFPAMGAFAVIIAFGLCRNFSSRTGYIIAWVLVILLAAADLTAFFCYLLPSFYP